MSNLVKRDLRIISPSHHICGERILKNASLIGLLITALGSAAAWAQQPDGGLSEKQMRGRQLLAQACGVCHLQPSMGAKTYGPPLNKASANGNNDVMRTFIMEGTPRMPAFKHHFKSADIDAIIDYVRTVPVQTDAQAAR